MKKLLCILLMIVWTSSNAQFTALKRFQTAPASPRNLVLSNNTLFGSTDTQNGSDTAWQIFSIRTDGTGYKIRFNHKITGTSPSSLILLGDKLYGTTYGGFNDEGSIFCVDTNGNGFKELHIFNNIDGSDHQNCLISEGIIYGVSYGGNNNSGTVYRIDTSGTDFRIIHSLTPDSDGYAPKAMIKDHDVLYGITYDNGLPLNEGNGTVFRLDTNGTNFKVLHCFYGDGAQPEDLVMINNRLYVLLQQSNTTNSSIVRIDTDGTGLKAIYQPTVFSQPEHMTYANDKLYVVASSDNVYPWLGGVYSIDTTGMDVKTIFKFSANEGCESKSRLIISDSSIYGSAIDCNEVYLVKDTNLILGQVPITNKKVIKICSNIDSNTIRVFTPISITTIEIINTNGQTLSTMSITLSNVSIDETILREVTLDVSNLSSGVYLLRLNKLYAEKFVVKR